MTFEIAVYKDVTVKCKFLQQCPNINESILIKKCVKQQHLWDTLSNKRFVYFNKKVELI